MLKFGFDSLKAVPRLFAYRNDVDIYTEDRVADKEFYKSLFKNLFNDTVKINDVTPLGCKANVLNAYDSQVATKRRKYYIVDGDLDLILGTNRKQEKNLIILDSYCIENYLIDEEGASELIYFSLGTESKENVKVKLNFTKWLNYNSSSLITLFLNFAILRKYGGGPVLSNATLFLKQIKKQTVLDHDKVTAYADNIKIDAINLLTAVGDPNAAATFENEFLQLNKKWPHNIDTLLKIVSSKNYLLPLLQFRINHCGNKGAQLIPKETFKLFLAKNSKLNRLAFLKSIIK
jgi:hypothetical protein